MSNTTKYQLTALFLATAHQILPKNFFTRPITRRYNNLKLELKEEWMKENFSDIWTSGYKDGLQQGWLNRNMLEPFPTD